MHYIIGTNITIESRPTTGRAKIGMTSSDIANLRKSGGDHTELKKKFTPGKQYTLTRIYKRFYEDTINNEVVVYRFVSRDSDLVELEFNTVKLAEKFIADTRGEDLPDYGSVYETKTD